MGRGNSIPGKAASQERTNAARQGQKIGSKKSILVVNVEFGVRESLRILLKSYTRYALPRMERRPLKLFRSEKLTSSLWL